MNQQASESAPEPPRSQLSDSTSQPEPSGTVGNETRAQPETSAATSEPSPAPEDAARPSGEDRIALTQPGTPRTGWQNADKVTSGIGKAADVVGDVAIGFATVMTKLYGLALLIVGIALIFLVPEVWWGAALIGLYGIYLLFPGSKFVIW